MRINTVVTGRASGLFENCYIVRKEENSKEAVVIDPGDGTGEIITQLDKLGVRVTHILLTHGHADHMASADDLRKNYDAKLAVSAHDADMLAHPSKNLCMFLGRDVQLDKPDILLCDGQCLEAAGLTFRVIETPGHTPGSVCFVTDHAMFSGDTLFEGSIGRTDFPGGSTEEIRASLKKLKALEENYEIYPGHGNATTLEEEKVMNPYMGW